MTRSTPARLLQRAPLLAGVNPNLLERLSATMLERRFVAGQDVVIQNDPGDSAYLIEAGRADVVVDGVKVNEVTSGDFIGELALIHTEGRRSATVTAISPLIAWELPRAQFEQILTQNPDTRKALTSMVKVLALANFLAISTTLRELSPKEQRDLASRIQERDFTAGEVIIEEGTVEGGAYILMSGEVQVITSDHGGRTRMLGTMNPGALFGETRILTGEPANATVKASKPSTVLVLSRSDFVDVVRRTPGIARDVFGMMRYRSRPRSATGIELAERQLPDGEWITILRDSARNSYFQLSELGRFIWDRLDGNHNVKDLSMEYLSETGQFMPLAIADIESALSSAGFLSEARPADEYWSALAQASPWRRAMSAAKRIMEWNTYVRNPDRVVGSAYRLLRVAFTPFGLTFIAMIGLTGLVAFFLATASAATSPNELGWPFFLLFYPALIVTVAFHEAGHALSTKHFGRRVNRIGMGWYWFGPIIFVDTTDMWTADRWPRVAVSMAGPITSFVVAGLAGAVAYLSTNTLLTAVAWQIALISYISVFLNFNPLMELDGYFILIDILERPNLRSESLRWLGLGLWSALKDPSKLREHRLELFYGIAVVLFIPIVALLSAYMYRTILQKRIEPIVGNALADSLLFAVVFLGLAIPLLALAGEIRGVGSRPAGGNR